MRKLKSKTKKRITVAIVAIILFVVLSIMLYPHNETWKLNEDGERIYYNKSPYSVANIVNEKRYLIQTESQHTRQNDKHDKTVYYIPAVQRDEGTLNLISNETFDISNVFLENEHATQYIAFIADRRLDL